MKRYLIIGLVSAVTLFAALKAGPLKAERPADRAVVALFCSDSRNGRFKQDLETHHPGFVEHNVHVYEHQVPGSAIYDIIHAHPAVREHVIEQITILLRKAQKEGASAAIALAYHEKCARYPQGHEQEQERDGLAAKHLLEDRLKDLHPQILLYKAHMDDSHITEIEIIERPRP
ncbi:hypothetical protein EXS71_00215 [Candidatus Uhrbacteria bacterium]|nr:hypothetical protein [Candidatus Uhrbacteria bacterium]